MTGWRIGYLCAPPPEITAAALKIHQYVALCAPVMGQIAAYEALRIGGEAEKDAMVREYRLRRNLFVDGLNNLGLTCHVPKGAFYAFPSVESTGMTDVEFAEGLLREQHVAVVPGERPRPPLRRRARAVRLRRLAGRSQGGSLPDGNLFGIVKIKIPP